MSTVYLSFSGGLDSTTLLYQTIQEGHNKIVPVFFHYGSKHNDWEYMAAMDILKQTPEQVQPLVKIDLASIFSSNNSALMKHSEQEVPAQSYNEEGSLDATVVAGRNLVMASILASLAENDALTDREVATVRMGMHSGDHSLYPDCRPVFLHCVELTVKESTEGRVKFQAPLMNFSKSDIAKMAKALDVPIAKTRSCYRNQEAPCGECGTCQERTKALDSIGFKE